MEVLGLGTLKVLENALLYLLKAIWMKYCFSQQKLD